METDFCDFFDDGMRRKALRKVAVWLKCGI
jgi:hypothetical protein